MIIVEYQTSLQSAYYPMTTLTWQTCFMACTKLVGLGTPHDTGINLCGI